MSRFNVNDLALVEYNSVILRAMLVNEAKELSESCPGTIDAIYKASIDVLLISSSGDIAIAKVCVVKRDDIFELDFNAGSDNIAIVCYTYVKGRVTEALMLNASICKCYVSIENADNMMKKRIRKINNADKSIIDVKYKYI